MQAAAAPHVRPGVTAPEKVGKFVAYWRKVGGGSLVISLLIHAGILVIAYFIVKSVVVEPKVDFLPGGGSKMGNDASQELKQKVSNKKNNLHKKSPMQRLVSTSVNAAIALPDLPLEDMEMPEMNSLQGGGAMSGGGFGSGGFGGGSGGGRGMGSMKGVMLRTVFGSVGKGEGLVGTFYDFKRERNGEAVNTDRGAYVEIIRSFAKGNAWEPPRGGKYFVSETKLYAKILMFKGIPDVEAGKAFQAPGTGPGKWLVHYTGEVQVATPGSYRLVGWGDNCLIIGFNGKVVLDASDKGYSGQKRESLGPINVPGKPNAAVFAGEYFKLMPGQRLRVDVLIGDEGGIFSAGALFQKEGSEIKRGEGGLPDLPAFIVAPLDHADEKLFEFVSARNLKGGHFQMKKSLFDKGM